MQTKAIWQSKTIWVNLTAAVVAVATACGVDLGITQETQATIVGGIMAVVNVVLRLTTKHAIKKR